MGDLIEQVGALLREAASEAVLPVFRRTEAMPEEKSPGEWVTTADRAAESLMAPVLAGLRPGSVVVGEEAASLDPSVISHLARDGEVWLLDPLDGTANFAAGHPPFSMMVALLRDGVAVASWMLDPLSDRLCTAELGSGAWRDGARMRCAPRDADRAKLSGAVLDRFLPDDVRRHAGNASSSFRRITNGTKCAGQEYPDIVVGVNDFALFWRTLPWDHVPGTLFLTEAGGMVARLDGSEYRAVEHNRPGLLVAASPEVWHAARDVLVPPEKC